MTPSSSRGVLSVALNLLGIGLISYDLAQRALAGAPLPIAVLAWLACGLWLGAVVVGERSQPVRTGLHLAMIATGSFVACSTYQVGFVPAIVGLIVVLAPPTRSLRFAGGTIAAAVVLAAIGGLIVDAAPATLVSAGSILLVAALGGLSRRQYRAGEAQARALLEERIAKEQERALVAGLSERSRIARDLHDVLAHALGGLVIQLEAVDALLESGRTAEARTRVVAARELAVSGLDDARRAVTALHQPEGDVNSIVEDLVTTHRSLGGEVTIRLESAAGRPADGQEALAPVARTALRRALQELLTNARRHAPGAPTTLAFDWTPDALRLKASTSGRGPGRPGGGHGLAGMRERVEAAGGSMTVRAGSSFDVTLELPRAAT